jgi:triacylglycerol lipase
MKRLYFISVLLAATAIVLEPAGAIAKQLQHSKRKAAMTDKTLTVVDKTLAYYELGQGPAAVIVHGVGGHKEDWRGVAEELAKTHHVFAIDMLGFGGSSKTGDDLSMQVQASAILALLDAHKIGKAAFIGNSVGGWVTATFAAAHPERVSKLVLIDAAGFKAMFEGAPPVNFDPGSPAEMDTLIRFVINSKVADTPGLAARAYAAYVSSGEKGISATWGKSLVISPRLEEVFPKITAPTLVLWGGDDKLFPSVLAGVFAGQIKGATSHLIPDAGHFPQIDNPEATIAAITAFLN